MTDRVWCQCSMRGDDFGAFSPIQKLRPKLPSLIDAVCTQRLDVRFDPAHWVRAFAGGPSYGADELVRLTVRAL